MKKLVLLFCLLVSVASAHAQFEKGKWVVNPSLTGLGLSYDTGLDKASFGLDVNGGAFVADNLALLIRGGLAWNEGGADTDVYSLGVGGRYYFSQVGIYLGANVNVDRWDWGEHSSDTKFSFGMEAGYAFFRGSGACRVLEYQWRPFQNRIEIGIRTLFLNRADLNHGIITLILPQKLGKSLAFAAISVL